MTLDGGRGNARMFARGRWRAGRERPCTLSPEQVADVIELICDYAAALGMDATVMTDGRGPINIAVWLYEDGPA